MKAWRKQAAKLKKEFTERHKGLTPPYAYARQVKVLTQSVKAKAGPSSLFLKASMHAGLNWHTEEIPDGLTTETNPVASDLETRALYSPVAL